MELAENGREAEARERLSQLVFREGAAQLNEPTQALVRARVDVQQDYGRIHRVHRNAFGGYGGIVGQPQIAMAASLMTHCAGDWDGAAGDGVGCLCMSTSLDSRRSLTRHTNG